MTAKRRLTFVGFIVVGLAAAFAVVLFVSPRASSRPDGLERVATDEGFIDAAEDSAVADGPLAGYAVSGVDDEGISTGLAGLIGVIATFAVGCSLFFVMRAVHGQRQRAIT